MLSPLAPFRSVDLSSLKIRDLEKSECAFESFDFSIFLLLYMIYMIYDIYDIFSYENFFYAHRFSEGKASF